MSSPSPSFESLARTVGADTLKLLMDVDIQLAILTKEYNALLAKGERVDGRALINAKIHPLLDQRLKLMAIRDKGIARAQRVAPRP